MIVIPMAGLSSRFFKAGYELPKYMLEARKDNLFCHSVKSFQEYFVSEKFVFIVRDVFNTPDFVRLQCLKLGISDYDIITLNEETRGQAETVALGLSKYKSFTDSITIFNIDTFRPNFIFPDLGLLGDGYLEVFKGSGDNWSFVKPISINTTKICLTTEKKPISDLCCTGLYHFKNIGDFFESFEHYSQLPVDKWDKGELYVAPLYNYLIKKGLDINYNLIGSEQVIFCGTPEEYNDFND